MNNVEVLVSTMNRENKDLLSKMKIASNAVIVNQCGRKGSTCIEYKENHVLWIDSNDLGLSKSRNIAIANAKSSIIVLADDDMEYIEGYAEVIENAFLKFPDADAIAFCVEGIEEPFKEYKDKEKRINFLSSMHLCSVELAFKRESIIKNQIFFNEKFGSGANYKMGEENIFLFNCLKKKLKIYYVPEKIACLHIGNSSWFQGFNNKYFFDRGAINRELFGTLLGRLMSIRFAISKYEMYKDKMSRSQAIRQMFLGLKDYEKGLKQDDIKNRNKKNKHQ